MWSSRLGVGPLRELPESAAPRALDVDDVDEKARMLSQTSQRQESRTGTPARSGSAHHRSRTADRRRWAREPLAVMAVVASDAPERQDDLAVESEPCGGAARDSK